MPRNRSAGRAPASRAPARPSAPAPSMKPQQRPASTMAAPPQAAAPAAAPAAPAASQGPGLFGQMASTAAYVSARFPLVFLSSLVEVVGLSEVDLEILAVVVEYKETRFHSAGLLYVHGER
ncbi:hypothetical protein E4U32_003596 [Claviceps aff. humidiphila group G2b]|nr:hypothetical protein E4U32_003596 [Claviceps aff. humidiphila group G2b]